MPTSNLITAIQSGKLPTVRAALAAGEKVNVRRGEPPLLIAAAKGNVAIVKELLAAGADPNGKISLGESVVYYAKSPAVAALLLTAGADPNALSKLGNAPLHMAAANGKTAYAKALLEGGAECDLRDALGQTPLFKAAWHGKADLVQLLLDAGADAQATDPAGETALHAIAGRCRSAGPKIVQMLLKAGADIDHFSDHDTALSAAAYLHDEPVAICLLKAGANVNAADKHGCTPLLSALLNENPKIALALLQAGANWSQRISKQHPNTGLAGRTILEILDQTSPRFQKQVRPAGAVR